MSFCEKASKVIINDRFYKGLAIAIREVQNATFSQGILMLFAIAFPCIFHIWGSHDPRRQPTVPVAEVHICSGKVSFSEGGVITCQSISAPYGTISRKVSFLEGGFRGVFTITGYRNL